MALRDGLVKTEFEGVFFKYHTIRMLTKRKGEKNRDRLFVLRYTIAGKTRTEAFGWESDGNTALAAHEKIEFFKANYRRGCGLTSIAEENAARKSIEMEEQKRIHEAENVRRTVEEAERNRPTILSIWKIYLDAKPDLKGLSTDQNRFENYIQPVVGNKTPQEILPLDIERLKINASKGRIGPTKKIKGKDGKIAEVKTAKKPQTVRNILELLRRIINFAVKRQIVPPVILHFDMPSVDNIVTEHLTNEQVRRLLFALDKEKNQTAVAVVRLILFTGIRRGEALKLRWENVDLVRARITLKDPKGGKSQILPISTPAVELLKSLPKSSDLVFPGREGKQRSDLKKPMDRIRKAAGLPEGFRPLHGLRHHYASTLASSGQVDLYTLQKLMTHKSPQMTQRYAHLADEAMTKAASVAASALEFAKSEESASATEC